MSKFNWLWRRVLRPALAYLVAAIMAALVIALFFYGLSLAEGGDDLTAQGIGSFLAISAFLGLYVAAFAVLPTILLIWLIRIAKLPRGWTDAAAGALIGAGMIHFVAFGASGVTEPPHAVNLLFAAGGLAGGLAYWFTAGKPRPPY
jgi:glucan phosphoethanolaminetransferase (alkaline phosphatase superfamily)